MMEKEFNDLTVAITVFERFNYFEEALNSVLSQTVLTKILIVDNCSSHNKFRDYVKKLNNKRVSYHKNLSNIGMVGNWNEAIRLVDTKWITILHDDDCLYPNFVESFKDALSRKKDLGAYCVKAVMGGEYKKLSYSKKIKNRFHLFKDSDFTISNITQYPGVIFKKQDALSIGLFDENVGPIADYIFWHKLSRKTFFYRREQRLVFYRQYDNQESTISYRVITQSTFEYRRILLKEFNNHTFLTFFSDLSTYYLAKNYFTMYNSGNIIDISEFSDELNAVIAKFGKMEKLFFINRYLYKISLSPFIRLLFQKLYSSYV